MATWPAKVNYASGDILTASQMNDVGGELNDLYTTAGFAAGKNKIINGDFYINQRGFTSQTTGAYGFDRWAGAINDGTTTFSAQTFTPGTAPVAGYEAVNFCRVATTGQTAAGAYSIFYQKIENVRTLANNTVTVSFWAKAASGTPKIAVELTQSFGSGGSADVNTYAGQVTLSTSWARYSVTVAVPSISGKTIGTGSSLILYLWVSGGSNFNSRTGSIGIQTNTFDFWGVQVEAGSVATSFQTATGTIQGELDACQRYYYRMNTGSNYNYSRFGMGQLLTTSTGAAMIKFPVTMRTAPTALEQTGTAANYAISGAGGQVNALTAVPVQDACSTETATWTFTCGTTGTAAGQATQFYANNNQTAYLAWSAEL